MTTAHYIHYQSSRLAFRQIGQGQPIMLLFHGFGQTGHAFQTLLPVFESTYTIFVFDLFFHGESTWGHAEQALEKKHWKEMMSAFLDQHRIEHFSVGGYSMGGKFALALVEAFPERVRELILLAPDGIRTSFWYSLATYPLALRHLFKSMITHPARFQSIATLAYRFRLIDRGVLRFVESQMNTEEKRNRVYYSWVVFRHLSFSMKRIASLLRQNKVRVLLITGRYDKVITARNMQRLTHWMPELHVTECEAGHTDLIEKSKPFLGSFLAESRAKNG